MIRKLLILIGLGRVLMAPVTMSAPVFGAMSVRSLGPREVFGLALIGLCAHLFGFILNDLYDFELDQTVSSRNSGPLFTGRISTREAWVFALLQVPLVYIIYRFWLKGPGIGILFLLASLMLSLIYNSWSKRGSLPKWIPELALALSIGALCLAGSLVIATSLSVTTVLFTLAMSIGLLILNSVPSGLKDLKTDSAYGVQSFVIWMNAQMVNEEQYRIPQKLRVYSLSLQISYALIVLSLVWIWSLNWWVAGLILLLCLYGTLHLRKILSMRSFPKMLNAQPLLSGVYNYCALAILLFPVLPVWISGLIMLLTLLVIFKPLTLASKIWGTDYGYFDPDRYFL